MTAMQIDRAVVEQALEALNSIDIGYRSPSGNPLEVSFDEGKCEAAITALRAVLAQQAEPVEDVLLSAAGLALDALEHDRQSAARTGRSISMLSLRAIEELRGALRAALAQQAEPRNQCGETCERARLCATCAQVLAQQDEPVEPVAKVELMMTGGNAGLATRIVEIEDHLRERLRPGQQLYIAPPQRKLVPLTEEEILKAIGWERAEMYMKLATNFPVDEAKQETLKNARAVERAVWEKNHG